MASPWTQVPLSTHGISSTQAHRERLLHRIEESKSEIKALERSCNALSPPNRIPPEVLSRIFVMVQWRSRARGMGRPGNLAWLNITHVCRHWRETAIACLALWTTLSFIKPEITQLMLQRSQNAPLVIDFPPLSSTAEEYREVIAQAISRPERVRSITLFSIEGYPLDLSFVLFKFSGPAPVLETLYLSGKTVIDLPEGFLEDRSPRLRTLHLSNCRVPDWDFLPLGSVLTALHLKSTDGFGHTRPTWNIFLAALQRMVLLEKLSLTQWLPKDDPTSCSWSSASRLPLKVMQAVSLTDSDPSIKRFFEVVRIPEARALEIKFPDVQDTRFLRGFMAQMATSWDGPSRKSLRRLRIVGQELNGPRFYFTFGTKHGRTLQLSFSGSTATADEVLNTLDGPVDFSHLTSLGIAGDALLTTETFAGIFGRLKKLWCISFSSDALTESFLDALAHDETEDETTQMVTDGSESAQRPSPSHTFPALSRLDLQDEEPIFQNRASRSVLISALRSRPDACPRLELNLFEGVRINKARSRRIARALPQIDVLYHANDDWIPFSDSDADSSCDLEDEGSEADSSEGDGSGSAEDG